MSAIVNGLYFLCAYTQRTCLQLNDAGAGSPLYAWEYSGNTEQKWYITQGSETGTYQIENLRYETYLTWPGGDPTGAVPQNIIQTTTPINWCINEIQAAGTSSYVLISPDMSFHGTWNVMGGSSANNTPIIMWPLDVAYDNSIFVAIPAPRDTLSSITLPTVGLTASLSVTSPAAGSTSAPASLTSSTATSATGTSGDRDSGGAQPSANSSSGLSLDNKIGLGIGIGFGVPTLLLSLWGIWVTIRIAKGRYEKHKFNPLASGDPMGSEAGHYEMPDVMGGRLPEAYTSQRHDWRYMGLPSKS